MPKIVDHDYYRQELLSKCFELFADKGYAAITMRQIAQGLGVSTGTLYHYFLSKQVLFEQLVEELVESDLHRATAELKDVQTLEKRIDKAFGFISRNQESFFKEALILADFYQQQQREGQQPSASDALRQAYLRFERSMLELLGNQ